MNVEEAAAVLVLAELQKTVTSSQPVALATATSCEKRHSFVCYDTVVRLKCRPESRMSMTPYFLSVRQVNDSVCDCDS